jgi:hypothetical protein
VSSPFAQRLIVLAGAGLLAVVAALAVQGFGEDTVVEPRERSVPAPGGGWYQAVAAPYRLKARDKRTDCGYRAGPKTLGVAHPVLPCGAKLFIRYHDVEVLTQVIDRGTGAPGREFDITAPLARELGVQGVQPIRWRFAAAS